MNEQVNDFDELKDYVPAIAKAIVFKTANRNSVRVAAADVKVAFRGAIIPLSALQFSCREPEEIDEDETVTTTGKEVSKPVQGQKVTAAKPAEVKKSA